jgi:hypothetical protein
MRETELQGEKRVFSYPDFRVFIYPYLDKFSVCYIIELDRVEIDKYLFSFLLSKPE